MGTQSIYVPGKVRTTQSPYFDSYAVAAGGNVVPNGLLKMFGNVQGLNGIGPNMTNMTKAFELSGGESFLCTSLRCVFLGTGAADIASFCQNFTVRLIAGSGSTAYCDAPAEYWAGGAGVAQSANNGVPDCRAVVPFDLDPIELTDGVNFRVEIVGTPFATVAALFLRVYLDGGKTQPAQ